PLIGAFRLLVVVGADETIEDLTDRQRQMIDVFVEDALYLVEQRECGLFGRPRSEAAHPRAHALHAAEQMLRGRRGGRGAALHRAGSGSAGRAVSLREPVSLPPLGCLLLIGFIVCTSGPDRRKWLPFSELGAVRLFLDRQLGGLADGGGHGDGGRPLVLHGDGGFWRGVLGQEHAGGVEEGLAAGG